MRKQFREPSETEFIDLVLPHEVYDGLLEFNRSEMGHIDWPMSKSSIGTIPKKGIVSLVIGTIANGFVEHDNLRKCRCHIHKRVR